MRLVFLSPYLFMSFITVFAVFAMSPLEMVRTKFQSKKGLRYPQLVLLVIASMRQEGLTSLWRGIGPTLLRDVPFSGKFIRNQSVSKAFSFMSC